jgi:ribosomal-protein-alanine N-acetyltransferase
LAIRRILPQDAEALAKIAEETGQAARWPKEVYLELPASPGGLGLACETLGHVTGFLIGRQVADEAEVLNLAVRSASRRQGQATALLSAAFEEFRRGGATRAFLEVRASNTAAIAFYTSHGFTLCGQRKAYYRDPVEDALCMGRNL